MAAAGKMPKPIQPNATVEADSHRTQPDEELAAPWRQNRSPSTLHRVKPADPPAARRRARPDQGLQPVVVVVRIHGSGRHVGRSGDLVAEAPAVRASSKPSAARMRARRSGVDAGHRGDPAGLEPVVGCCRRSSAARGWPRPSVWTMILLAERPGGPRRARRAGRSADRCGSSGGQGRVGHAALRCTRRILVSAQLFATTNRMLGMAGPVSRASRASRRRR